MALSGNIDHRLTAAQIIERALKKLGILGQGFTASADEQADALDVLADMLKTWSTEGPFLWSKAEQTILINAGLATYPLSPRPRLVYNVRWCDSVVTNRALHCRDWTQAAWSKTNVTAALTQTGIDGTANTATLLTASAGNGTVLQTVTRAEDDWMFGLSIKRVTGTGDIDITLDGGATWTTQDDLSADYWTQVGIDQDDVTNPQFGVRIVTSGNAIAVDYAMASIDDVSSTSFEPILTTTANASRGVERLPMTEWDAQDWDKFIYKNNQGTPLRYFVDKQRTQTNITLWPVPNLNGNYAIRVGYERALEPPDSGDDDVDAPEEFMEAIIVCLASRLAEDYQITHLPHVQQLQARAATLYQQCMGFDRWGDVEMRVAR